MKYSEVWSRLLTQNLTLRTAIVSMGVCVLYLGGIVIYQASKDPLIVERSCYSKLISSVSSKHNEDEIKAFLELALSQRFDSDKKPYAAFLTSALEERVRVEQEELQKNGMRQKVIINQIKIGENESQIDADRLISVKHIRSAFQFPLSVKLNSTARTTENPYGLQLVDVTSIKVDAGKDASNE